MSANRVVLVPGAERGARGPAPHPRGDHRDRPGSRRAAGLSPLAGAVDSLT